ncbi:MAG: type VI secretion system contractile sheath large subunit [Gemmatimonadaceae bacterium]
MSSAPFRILILGDFGGREHRGLSDAASLKTRRVRQVDRDDVDAAIAAIAPVMHLALAPGAAPIAVPVSQLDDFHPDRIIERVADFVRLRALRDGASSQNATAPRPAASRAQPVDDAAVSLAEGSVLDMILDADSSPTRPVVAPRDDLAKFVAQAVDKHVVAPRSVDQETLIAQIDDVITATMRIVLHHPNFQSTEALWRGLWFLLTRLDTDENLQVYIADVSQGEVAEAARAPADAAGRGLLSILRGEGPGAHGAWSLVVGAYTFAPDEIPLVASVAGVAQTAGVPWMSAADSRFAGAHSFGNNADPDDWDAAPLVGWEAFRRTAAARWIGLALPRFLLRVPYGARTDECETMAFEEAEDGALAHDQYLWGNSALLAALLFGEAASNDDDLPTHGTLDGFPLFVAKVDGLPEVLPVAEAFFGGRAVTRLLDGGLTAIASERDGDSLRVPRLQAVSRPAAPLAAATGGEA